MAKDMTLNATSPNWIPGTDADQRAGFQHASGGPAGRRQRSRVSGTGRSWS